MLQKLYRFPVFDSETWGQMSGATVPLLYYCALGISFVEKLQLAMADLKHLVLVKFKGGVVVDDLVKAMEKLATEMETVKAFEWGHDSGSEVSLRQGFTHTFILTFKSAEDFAAYSGHPNHLQFAGTFAAAIENILVFDYPPNIVKPPHPA